MCIYICVYTYICVCICVSVCVCVCIYMCVYIDVYQIHQSQFNQFYICVCGCYVQVLTFLYEYTHRLINLYVFCCAYIYNMYICE